MIECCSDKKIKFSMVLLILPEYFIGGILETINHIQYSYNYF